jgi:hypothetical protein
MMSTLVDDSGQVRLWHDRLRPGQRMLLAYHASEHYYYSTTRHRTQKSCAPAELEADTRVLCHIVTMQGKLTRVFAGARAAALHPFTTDYSARRQGVDGSPGRLKASPIQCGWPPGACPFRAAQELGQPHSPLLTSLQPEELPQRRCPAPQPEPTRSAAHAGVRP